MRKLVFLACTSTISLTHSVALAQSQEPAPFQMQPSDVQVAAASDTVFDGTDSAGSSALETSADHAIIFRDAASAGSSTIINNGGQTSFEGGSTAAVSSITANDAGRIDFSDTSTADDSDIVVNAGGALRFSDDANAGTSQITNNASARFAGRSSAATAVIVVNETGELDFSDRANAGNAQIANSGRTNFTGRSSLENAVLTNNETGTLAFGDNATGGAQSLIQNNGQVTFADRASLGGGYLIVNDGASARFAGRSNAGTNLITSSGQLVFTQSSSAADVEIVGNVGGAIEFADNASAGNARIASGAGLRFAGRSTAANADITMAPGATIAFVDDADGGSARLQLDAGSALDITGARSEVAMGVLAGAGDVRLGARTLAVGNDDPLVVFAGRINDGGAGGSLVKRGSGIWNLAGQNAYSGATRIESGTLEAGRENAFSARSAHLVESGASLALAGFDQEIGSLSGSGTVDLATANLTTGGDGRSTEFSGTIGGTGGLIKTGTGGFALTGVSTYSGATAVRAGTLRVDGDIALSAVSVGAEATLLGDGRVGTTVVAGTLQGRANGNALTVAGDLTLGSGATMLVDVSANAAGRFEVDGTAFLGGVLVLRPTSNIAAGSQYELISANAVEGTFEDVRSSFAFLDADLIYGPASLLLRIERNTTEFESVGESANQRATARAVDALGNGNVLHDAVVSLDAEAARAAFDNLSGEGHANALDALPKAGVMARQAVLARLRERSALPGAWINAQTSNSRLQGDGNGAQARYTSAAVIGGIDFAPSADLRVGLAAHYADTGISNAARSTNGDVTSAGVTAYAGWHPGPWRVRTGATLSAHEISLDRQIAVGSLQSTASSHYSAWSAGAFGEVGYAIDYQGTEIEPYLGISYLHARTDGFAETGAGPANLMSSGNRLSRTDAEIGVRVSRTYTLNNGMSVRPSVAVGYSRNLSGDTAVSNHQFSGSEPFSVSSAQNARDTATVAARLDAQLADNLEAGLFYTGSFSEKGHSHTIGAALLVKF